MTDYMMGQLKRAFAIIHSWDDGMPGWEEVTQEDRDKIDLAMGNVATTHFLESALVEDFAEGLWVLMGALLQKYRSNANLQWAFCTAHNLLADFDFEAS